MQVELGNKALVDPTDAYGDTERALLLNKVTLADAYLKGTTHTYENLKSYIVDIKALLEAFEATAVAVVVTP